MSRSSTALQVLLWFQDISIDYSNGENSNSNLVDALDKELEKMELGTTGKESGINSSSEDNDNHPPNQVQVNEDLIGKDRTLWHALVTSHVQPGRL